MVSIIVTLVVLSTIVAICVACSPDPIANKVCDNCRFKKTDETPLCAEGIDMSKCTVGEWSCTTWEWNGVR
jgi:hypothetical protein